MNIKFYIYSIILIIIIAIFVLFGIIGYPLLGSDSYCFLPTSIHLFNNEGLINKLYMPLGIEEMKFYPPFFPYFQSLFIFNNTPNSIYLSLTITSVLTLIIVSLIFYRILKDSTLYLYIPLLLLAVTSGLDISSGRPEILLNLLLSIAVLVNISSLRSQTVDLINGLLFTLIGITSPITSIYIFIIILIYYTYTNKKISNFITLFISSTFTFLIFLFLYPYSFLELIHNMKSQAKLLIVSRDDYYTISEFVKYHILNPTYSFYILLFLFAIIIVFKKFSRSVLLLSLTAVLLFIIYYFGFRNPATNYYVYNLYILYISLIAFKINSYKSYKYLYVIVFLLCSVGFIRRVSSVIYYHKEVRTINKTNAEIKNLNITNYKENSSFWILYYYRDKVIDTTSSYLITQQLFNSNIDTNKAYINNTNFKNFKVLNFTIANNPPFYYYTIHKE